jgi:hypothetical protein
MMPMFRILLVDGLFAMDCTLLESELRLVKYGYRHTIK